MRTKLEAIIEEWGAHYSASKNQIDENGWALINLFDMSKPTIEAYLKIRLDEKIEGNIRKIRPQALAGIEDNNGWTVIDGPESLPTEQGQFQLLEPGSSMVMHGFWHIYTDVDRAANQRLDWLRYYTHHRKVVPIPLPIYGKKGGTK